YFSIPLRYDPLISVRAVQSLVTMTGFLHSGVALCIFFFFCFSDDHRDLHSFPTRRSSDLGRPGPRRRARGRARRPPGRSSPRPRDWKSTRLNSSHVAISYAVFRLQKKILEGPLLPDLPPHPPAHDRAAPALLPLEGLVADR